MSYPLVQSAQVVTFQDGQITERQDLVAVEEPLEIRLEHGKSHHRKQRTFAITMRSPGHDFELAMGLLFSEGIISRREDIREIKFCRDTHTGERSQNLLLVSLQPRLEIDWKGQERNTLMNTSCGLCGKTSIDSIRKMICNEFPLARPLVDPDIIPRLDKHLYDGQTGFRHTGGLHAVGLFDMEGRLVYLREDIGRHNAMDKVVGNGLYSGALPFTEHLIYWSGRASFELVQKAIRAGIPAAASVGPPSSLAIQLAREFGMLLIGFVRGQRFQIYAGVNRLTRPIVT